MFGVKKGGFDLNICMIIVIIVVDIGGCAIVEGIGVTLGRTVQVINRGVIKYVGSGASIDAISHEVSVGVP